MKGRLSLAVMMAAAPLLALVLGSPTAGGPKPVPRLDPELGIPWGDPLQSVATVRPPVMDGEIEAVWDRAPVLKAELHYGLHGDEPHGTVELRSLHDAERVFFAARWPAAIPGGEPNTWRNLLTVHWRLVDQGMVSGASTGSDGLACTVGCHTVTVDDQGHLVGVRPETIPPGPSEDLPAGGGWSAGEWRLEWSRPRASDSPYDQDLVDPAVTYRFFVKLFLGLDDRPDAVSDLHELQLIP